MVYAMTLPLADRQTAGRALAESLQAYAGRDDVLVLALPRGGVPVALEISKALGAPLDLILVRKLGTPGNLELAMGAIASGGIRVLNPEIIASRQIGQKAIEEVAAREKRELKRRQQSYRGNRPLPRMKDRLVILVDDGIATGATMQAAIKALKVQKPTKIVVAVPVAPADTVAKLKKLVDEVVCSHTPEPFMAIGNWYDDFSQLSDEDVRKVLEEAWEIAAGGE
jgi:putative phosphoribosyl transferase